jgi:hypothetical protein
VEWSDVPLAVGENVVQVRGNREGEIPTDAATWIRTGFDAARAAAAMASSSRRSDRDDRGIFGDEPPIVLRIAVQVPAARVTSVSSASIG